MNIKKTALILILAILIFFPGKTLAGEASFYLSPAKGNYSVGQSFSTIVLIDTGGSTINAGEAEIFFPPNKLQVLNISKSGSIFSLWIQEPSFSNSQGTISFGGGLPSPGYKGSSGKVITVSFRTISKGEARVDFRKERIIANDPKGTDVFSFSRKGVFIISLPDELLIERPAEKPAERPAEKPVEDVGFPHPFQIMVDNEGDSTNPRPLLYFETTDDISGISHYELEIAEKLFVLESGETMPYRLPGLSPGSYDVLVRAFNNAGNYTESRSEIKVESIPTPEITVYSEFLNPAEELFYAGGIALPESKITLLLKRGEEIIFQWETYSDQEGNWFLIKEAMVRSGTYTISAGAEDKRGAISYFSEPLPVRIVLGALAIGSWIIDYKALNIAFLVILIGVLIFVFGLFRKMHRTKVAVKRETKDLRKKFYKEYKELQEAVAGELKSLRKSRKERGFTEEEKDKEKKLLKELADVEKVFDEELKDIEEV